MLVLDGKSLAESLQASLAKEVMELPSQPCLAVCLIGEDPPSQIYVKNKRKACERVGIKSLCTYLPASASCEDILSVIHVWNDDPTVHGILVQLPLPGNVDRFMVMDAIRPEKDVDGFHACNLGRIVYNRPRHLPCTPLAVKHILSQYQINTVGKNLSIISRSLTVGQPLALMMVQDTDTANATVTICHDKTSKLADVTKQADIIVVAVGKRPHFHVGADMVKKGAVVIDVGINRVDNRIMGDVDFDEVAKVASALTPVPGSVGPLTVSFLLKNTVDAYKLLLGE